MEASVSVRSSCPFRTPQPCAARTCPRRTENPIRPFALTAALVCALLTIPCARSGTRTARAYAHTLTIATWHSEREWQALDAIVQPESGWDPCSYFPSRHDCSYIGTSSCGIPQANPCPPAWRGRMWTTRFAQVRWLIGYVQGRYGSPSRALAFRRLNGWY